MADIKRYIHAFAIAATRFFSRFMPDKVPLTFIGAEASGELCRSIGQSGLNKLLIVTDAGLVQLGIVGRITSELDSAGVAYVVYDGVEPDPNFAQVQSGLDLLVRERCDGVLALGGGSPMDAAKVIAVKATNSKPLHKLEGLLKVRTAPLPLFAIPTTAGTGSEVTIAAVVSDTETHAKKFFVDPQLVPLMTALDPTLMEGLPPHITAATGMDALTHAVESYLAPTSRPQTERWALAAVRLIFANLPTAFADGKDLEARKSMALASYYAGLAFTRTGVGYVHAIAHTFGAYYGTPHGLANAIVLPHILEFSQGPARKRLAELGNAIGLPGNGEAEIAKNFINAVAELETKVAIPTTLEALERRHIAPIAEQALAEAWANYPVPRYMTAPECEELLERMVH